MCVLPLAFGAVSVAHAKTNKKYASIVVDADTGMILHQRHADKELHPASLTKVMTLLMVFDALEKRRIKLSDRIYVSRRAESMVPSKIGLRAGSRIRLKDAIHALVTKSANDVAVALAEHLGGSEYNFARMMTRRARLMGMTRTRFMNASGLHHKEQISTARDMALLARIVIKRYPKYYRYFSKRKFTYAGTTYRNHNRLMDSYAGMDGMKTGYIQASGFNLIASAVRNEQRLIGVVFGGRKARTRNKHMASLLDRSFKKLDDIRIASAKIPLPPKKPQTLLAMADIVSKAEPAAGSASHHGGNMKELDALLNNRTVQTLIGQGDSDPQAQNRFETGLMAISAHDQTRYQARYQTQYQTQGSSAPLLQKAAHNYTRAEPQNWFIQVGAFKSRVATDQAIIHSLERLPAQYAHKGKPVIAPVKTRNGWMFRARLAGFSRTEATQACLYIQDCISLPAHVR